MKAASLHEYFERQLSGEVLGIDKVPSGFTQMDKMLVKAPSSLADAIQILHQTLRFGVDRLSSGAELVFVSVSEDELEIAKEAIAPDSNQAMLPLNLNGREVCLRDPTSRRGSWLPISCPSRYIKSEQHREDTSLRIPPGAFPTPYIPHANLHIFSITPCCGLPVSGVPVYADGRRMGTTDAKGELHLALPPGKHEIMQKGQTNVESVEVQFKSGPAVEARLCVGGELFFYLQDLSSGDDAKFAVKITSSRYQIPMDAKRFSGDVAMDGQRVAVPRTSKPQPRPMKPLFTLQRRQCSEVLQSLEVCPVGGEYELNDDFTSWLASHECVIKALYEYPPATVCTVVSRLVSPKNQRRHQVAVRGSNTNRSSACPTVLPLSQGSAFESLRLIRGTQVGQCPRSASGVSLRLTPRVVRPFSPAPCCQRHSRLLTPFKATPASRNS